MVSIYAHGSLLPLSSSKSEAVPNFRLRRRERRMENTEAAEAIYAPAADYCLETQKESIDSYPLPIHPGAEKYYREAGLIQ